MSQESFALIEKHIFQMERVFFQWTRVFLLSACYAFAGKVVKFCPIVVLAWVLDYMPSWKGSPRGDFDREKEKLVSSLFLSCMSLFQTACFR